MAEHFKLAGHTDERPLTEWSTIAVESPADYESNHHENIRQVA